MTTTHQGAPDLDPDALRLLRILLAASLRGVDLQREARRSDVRRQRGGIMPAARTLARAGLVEADWSTGQIPILRGVGPPAHTFVEGLVPGSRSQRQSYIFDVVGDLVLGRPEVSYCTVEEVAVASGIDLALVAGNVEILQAEGLVLRPAPDRVALTPAGTERAARNGASPSIWRPSRSGPLTTDDLAEASILLDNFGSWIAQLADDDPRLREADAVLLIFRSQIALEGEADRVHIRRAIENATSLMGGEIRAAVAEALADVDDNLAEPVRDAVDAVVTAAEQDDDDAWPPALEQLDAAFDRWIEVAPLTPPEDPTERVGRGKAMAKFSGKEAAAALVRAGAVEVARAAWRLAFKLIDFWM